MKKNRQDIQGGEKDSSLKRGLSQEKKDYLKTKLDQASQGPGVYMLKDKANKIIYIGKALNLRNRLRNYFRLDHEVNLTSYGALRDSLKTTFLKHQIFSFDTILTDSENEALILEAILIKRHQPRYNVRLRDDKRYPYICVSTAEDFPRIFITRNLKRKIRSKANNPNLREDKYFGPYTDVFHVRKTMEALQKIFRVRSCQLRLPQQKLPRPCLEYDIGRCDAPCTGYCSQQDYYHLIEQLLKFLHGDVDQVVGHIKSQIKGYAEKLEFEKAAECRDQLNGIEAITANQKMDLLDGDNRDLLAMARQQKEAAIVQFCIRNGLLVTRNQYFFTGDENWPDEEFMEAFFREIYLQKMTDQPPPTILSSVPIRSKKIYERHLSQDYDIRIFAPDPENNHENRQDPFACYDSSTLQSQSGQWTLPHGNLLRLAQRNAQMALHEELARRLFRDKRRALDDIRRQLNLKELPRRIDCFDISTMLGGATVASMVSCLNGQMDKSKYRHYRIKSLAEGQQNDYAAIHEAVARYLQKVNIEGNWPHLILIDGGKGQLNAALNAARDLGLEQYVIIASLAKKEERVFLPNKEESLVWAKNASGLLLLRSIRDEAHRFAIGYHRKLRGKTSLESRLDKITGIGPRIRNLVLNKLNGKQNIDEISLDHLESINGIGKKTALKIFQGLQNGR